MSLGLEDKLSLSDSEKKLYNQPGLTEEPKEIFEKTSEVPLTVAEVGYILELLDSEKMGLPKRIETLDLCEKLEKVKNGQNEV